MERSCCASPGAYVSVSLHALAFKYIRASVFVREMRSDSVESGVSVAVSSILSAEGGDVSACRFQHCMANIAKSRDFASWR